MNRKIAALLCALIAVLMLIGACTATPEAEEDATPSASPDTQSTLAVAEVNGEPIYYDDYYAMYESMCLQYGVSTDDETYGTYIKDMVLESLVEEKVLRQKFQEEGYMDLSADQQAQVEADAAEDLNSYVDYYYGSTIESELGEDYTDEEYEAAREPYKTQLLEDWGMTKEEFVDYFVFNIAQEEARKDKVGSIVPTDEEVQAKYDEEVAAAKESMDAAPSVYEQTVNSGGVAYYVPEGVRTVRQVLISVDEEWADAISLLRNEGLDAQADYLLENALADIQAEADDVLAKLKAGKITFDEAIEQYNDDPGMTETGYPVTEGSTSYVESFTTAAMGLSSIGDYTDLVASDYGYHIIEYYSDLTAGPVALDTVRDTIYDQLLTTLQEEAWASLVDEWKSASTITYFEENM